HEQNAGLLPTRSKPPRYFGEPAIATKPQSVQVPGCAKQFLSLIQLPQTQRAFPLLKPKLRDAVINFRRPAEVNGGFLIASGILCRSAVCIKLLPFSLCCCGELGAIG